MDLKIIPLTISVFILHACVQHQSPLESNQVHEISDTIKVEYAEGFEVNYTGNFIQIISHSIANNSAFADTLEFPTAKVVPDLVGENVLAGQIENIACQSSTHVAFLSTLKSIDLVAGLCGMEYVQNSEINTTLAENNVAEICAAEQVDMEVLQKINTDLFLIYPFETEGKAKYDAAGIRTFFIAEYLEQTALARLEWIKLFGLITGKSKEANVYFEKAESEYLSLIRATKQVDSKFILNLPYKESWFMPSANSMIVNLIEDAGLTYYYPSSGITENETRSTEAVWNDAMFAEYWIIMASRPVDFSLADLLAEEPVYKEFLSVKKNQVIFCNTATSDYFVQGVVEPQIILKDILFATGQVSNHQPKYFSLLK
jgi:iron complex transport system substrate-binding protein